ncbi:MAG: hypothetical protein LV481_04625 [Methylacidiphilales bacterium]|nr:hypothetical protein [Candidatus Methylacidiphilales bacterium]
MSGQHPVRIFPTSTRKDKQQTGIDDEGDYQLTPERLRLAEIYGWGIVSALDDDELSEANCQRLHDLVLAKQNRADLPAAGLRSGEDFERGVLAQHMGSRVVEAMGRAEVHAHYLGAVRKGLIELDGTEATTEFALVNRIRNDEGEFAPNDETDSEAVQRAYDPRARRTGRNVGAGMAAGAGLASALAHTRKLRKAKLPRLGNGGRPILPGTIGADFAANDDGSHPIRDTVAGIGAGALGVAGLLALRKRRLARLASGMPTLPPKTIDIDTEALDARLPFMTRFAMGHPGTYKIARRNLRGKKPPGVPKVSGGKLRLKPKHHSLAFLINDPDFPIVPQQDQKLPPGMKRRVPLARSRKEVLARLKALTQLSRRDFGAGSLAAGIIDSAIDAETLGNVTAPKKKKLLIDANGNVISPTWLPDPGRTSTGSFASAIARLHEFGIGGALLRGGAQFAPEVAAIGAGDVIGESVHDRIVAARERKKKQIRQRGGIQATPGMGTSPGVQTTMSAVHDTLLEFDHGNERISRAKRKGTTAAAAGAGGVAGAIGGLKYDQGSPVAHSDLKPGDRVYRRFGPAGLFQHAGIVGEDGKITHRTSGSTTYRAIKPDSFAKTGKAPTYRESNPTDLPRGKAARNASRAAGTRAGKYCGVGNNCQTAVERIASKGRPVSGQLRRAGIGAAVGAIGAGTVASILNRRKDNRGNH